MRLFSVAVAFVALQMLTLQAPAAEPELAHKLVGEWQGPRHIRVYYADGSFTLDPQPGAKPLGTWKLEGRMLITQFAEDPKPMVEQIVKVTDTEIVSIYDGTRYTYKRVVHR
jgi:hypothetical protein